MTKTRKRRPDNLLPDVLGELDKLAGRIDNSLQNLRRPGPILPADVGKRLPAAMLARENVLEDAHYLKIVPNDYLVELNEDNYRQRYEPVEKLLCDQWREKLLKTLNTTNSRQGRKEYRFGGPVRLRIQPVADLGEDEVRIRCRINAETRNAAGAVPACLELLSQERQWPLQAEVTLIGRDPACDIFLDLPAVHQTRLISGQHAYIRHQNRRFFIYDGSPQGKASINGTFVNGGRITAEGRELQAGDVIILAALNPAQPRLDTPGVVAFRFLTDCG